METVRPDPDQLLQQITREEARATRGKLKIFFGACAGVGKTYAMLSSAHEQQQNGVRVLIGVAETHGRSETAVLLDGLPSLPLRQISYRGRELAEFDLDSALSAAPQLIVVDELAHSNVPGSRHTKRWQDIDELLAVGIDVYTALNVQHLESLNDVVGSITGTRVNETVPDHVFDAASEVTLCDLPPDELITRLKAGKVYLADQAERAAKHFFRHGNLIALRELALRRMAERVNAQMLAWRADRAIRPIWPTAARLVACIGPQQGEQVVRATALLAERLEANWLAVYVETPALARQSAQSREGAFAALRLAEELGAETANLAASHRSDALADFIGRHNISIAVLGAHQRHNWRDSLPWRRLLTAQLSSRLPGLALHQVALDSTPPAATRSKSAIRYDLPGYAGSLLVCALTTILAAALLTVFDLANIVMLYLLAVVGIAYRWGRGPGALAALLAVVGLDFFFVPPRFSFTIADTQYLFTFTLLLTVALGIGQLAARLKFAVGVAQAREARANALAALARELSGALTVEQVLECLPKHLDPRLRAKSALLLPDSRNQVQITRSAKGFTPDPAVAQWVYDHDQPAGVGTQTLPAANARYLPLTAPMRTRGVLALQVRPAALREPESAHWLDACAAQIALALERIHYVEVAQETLVKMESERLRHALLSGVSHDLRTPLTALVGLAETAANPSLPPATRDALALDVHEQAQRLALLVDNLLSLARLQSGQATLHSDWQSMEELVGSALAECKTRLAGRTIHTHLPAELPLVHCDPVLIERVLVNLLDNAAKHTPPDSRIEITARVDGQHFIVDVDDNGPGLPDGDPQRLFDTFARGQQESATPGAGLGLALARTIIEAHYGTIQAHNLPGGGARFRFVLPFSPPPEDLPEPAT